MLTAVCWQGEKRTRFLASLFDWITARVANTSASPGASSVPYLLNSEPGLSLNQRLAKWQFIALDLNRNRVSVFFITRMKPPTLHPETASMLLDVLKFLLPLFTIMLLLRYWKRGS